MREELENIILMGLGAMALTTEKAQDLKEELLKKGEEIYKKGEKLNEELKHNIGDKIKENVTVVVKKPELSKEELAEQIKNMDEEDKKEIMNLLKKNQQKSK